MRELPEEMTITQAADYLGMASSSLRRAHIQGRIAFSRYLNPRMAMVSREEVLRYQRTYARGRGNPSRHKPAQRDEIGAAVVHETYRNLRYNSDIARDDRAVVERSKMSGRKATSVRLSAEADRLIKALADKLGIKQSAVIEMAIRKLAQQEDAE